MDMSLEEFVLNYKGYARIIASKFVEEVKDYGIEFDDLYQVGCLALIEKYNDYESQKSSPSTYAYMIIYYYIINYINRHNCITHVPTELNYIIRSLKKIQIEFYKINGREMTYEESLQFLKKTSYSKKTIIDLDFVIMIEQIKRYQFLGMQHSLNDQIKNYDIISGSYGEEAYAVYFEDILSSNDNVELEVIDNLFELEILNFLDNIPEIPKNIFIETLGLNDGICKTRRELAKKYNMSHQGVDYHYNKTLSKVKKYIIENNLI